jgi:hypothetical protein
MVIHIKFEKKNNINITNEEIIKNMNIIDNYLKKDDNNIEIYVMNNIFLKNKNYFIILCIMIIILAILIYYIKNFIYK